MENNNGLENYKLAENYLRDGEYEKAYNILIELSEKKVGYSMNAMYRLGWMHYNGYYVEKNFEKAFNYFKESRTSRCLLFYGSNVLLW